LEGSFKGFGFQFLESRKALLDLRLLIFNGTPNLVERGGVDRNGGRELASTIDAPDRNAATLDALHHANQTPVIVRWY
jgi:hypothetical protein